MYLISAGHPGGVLQHQGQCGLLRQGEAPGTGGGGATKLLLNCERVVNSRIYQLLAVPRTGFGSADFDVYTIYLSLCTQSADPNHFRGIRCM